MSFLKPRFYICNNSVCHHGYDETLFNERYYARYNGVCPGKDDRPCGQRLTYSHTKNRIYKTLFLSVFILSGLTFIAIKINAILYPPPISGVFFAKSTTTVNEKDATVSIEIQRNVNLNKEIVVAFSTRNGTAIDGLDYIGGSGGILFLPGETKKVLLLRWCKIIVIKKAEKHLI